MLRKQLDGMPVGDGIGLRQISHCFDKQTLSIHIPGIIGALAFFAANIRCYGDCKNFGHEAPGK
jgi:hypothetical protein